jgi:phosphopantothenoylcysteine decarboxylase/phosphopantothenate--cysteine ligase
MKTLTGKMIILAVTGSIAAVETIKLAHALRRRGAMIQPVMSEAATRIIHPDALTYACGRETITRISGLVEHVQFCGDERNASLLLIAPCTANSISKIACGIDDTSVTTFATTARGSRMPIIVAPAMHHAMFRHTGVMDNLERLRSWGIGIVGPLIEEGKAKMADISHIVIECERELMGKPLTGRTILITSGGCSEPVDDVRILTTRSSGLMGKELAKAAYRLGASVTIVHQDHLSGVTNIRTNTAASMLAAVSGVLSCTDVDIYISAAAISDFAPVRQKGKIPSGKPLSIELVPLPKIIDQALQKSSMVVAFKLGEDSPSAAVSLLEKGVTLVAANTSETMGSDSGSYSIIGSRGNIHLSGSKEDVAYHIFDLIIHQYLTLLPPVRNADTGEDK